LAMHGMIATVVMCEGDTLCSVEHTVRARSAVIATGDLISESAVSERQSDVSAYLTKLGQHEVKTVLMSPRDIRSMSLSVSRLTAVSAPDSISQTIEKPIARRA